jgi:hypothetical protein
VYAHGSTVYIGLSSTTPFDNHFYDGSAVLIEEPIASEIINNEFMAVDGQTAITVSAASSLSSRTKIQENDISAPFGIVIQNIASWPSVTNTNHRVFINDNTINTVSNGNGSGLVLDIRGIAAFTSPGVVIGNNTLICGDVAGGAVPDATNNGKAIGISLIDCPLSIIGKNELHYFGRALYLAGDATGSSTYFANNDQYYCNEFASCYHGIYLEWSVTLGNGTTTNFGSTSVAVDNKWTTSGLPLTTTFGLGRRIWDNRNSWPLPPDIYYHYSVNVQNPTNPHYPTTNQGAHTFPYYVPTSNPCNLPANNKSTFVTVPNDNFLIVFPNPASEKINFHLDMDYQNAGVEIYNSNGQLFLSAQFSPSETSINTSSWPPGIYLLKITIDENQWIERFAIF